MSAASPPDAPEKSPEPNESRLRRAARLTDASTVALVFPIAALVGFFGGRMIGGWFGAPGNGALIGLLFGIVSGFYNLWKVARQLERETSAEQTTREHDDDPE